MGKPDTHMPGSGMAPWIRGPLAGQNPGDRSRMGLTGPGSWGAVGRQCVLQDELPTRTGVRVAG